METTTTAPQLTKAPTWDPDLPEFDVTVDGVVIGRVYKGWWRTGGAGWSNTAVPTTRRIGGTRREAVAHLVSAVA